MPLNQADDLHDFTKREITLDGVSRTVWQQGTGPGVLIFPEMPGISPHVARFARWVSQAGCTVYLPSLFGLDGAVADVERGEQVFAKLCVSAEFRLFAGVNPVPSLLGFGRWPTWRTPNAADQAWASSGCV
ncbi:MAG: hypothetical protein V9E81_11355 [Marmoricola sp.]